MGASCDCAGIIAFAIPFVGMTANVLTQMALAHATGRLSRSIISGALIGLLLTNLLFALLTPYSGQEWLARFTVAMITYIGLAFCFWATLNLNITSLRIRMLREMLVRPNHEITLSELEGQYKPGELVERRIARLLAAGQIKGSYETGYSIERKGVLTIAKLTVLMRRIVIPEKRQ